MCVRVDLSIYKCRGSLATWVLYYRLEDAFVVWMLAQKFDRERQQKITGYINNPYFITQLSRWMNCTKRTAKKRLARALEYRFLDEYQDNKYMVTGHRKMFEKAMDHHYNNYQNNNLIPSPHQFISIDHIFTRKLNGWIDPESIRNTRSLLLSAVAVQGNVMCRSLGTSSRILGFDRTTLQRLFKQTGIQSYERHLALDVHRMLVDCDMQVSDVIDVFQKAEDRYRKKGRQLHGRKTLHKRFIPSLNTFVLTSQLPNHYVSKHDLKIVPAMKGALSWLRSRDGADSVGTVVKHRDTLPGWSRGQYQPHKGQGCNAIPLRSTHFYVEELEKIVKSESSFILATTGARKIREISFANPRVLSAALQPVTDYIRIEQQVM